MHGLCQVHKDIINNCLLIWPISSTVNATTYKLVKFFVTILKVLTSIEYTVEDVFAFAEQIVEQDSTFYIGSPDVNSLFNNIALEENFDICAITPFINTEKVWKVYEK